jgi:monovalent cation/hydrogen antiporter
VTRLVVPDLGWEPALAFAAAVAPTDTMAATSVMTRLAAPRRMVTIIEGESLSHDGIALTAFGLAVEAMAHPFTFGHGVARLIFLLESALFVLLGLELRPIVGHLSGAHPAPWLAVAAAAVVAAVIVIRLGWELALLPLVRFRPGPRPASRQNPVGQRLVIGWAGMRGAISLAVALSLPTMLNGRPFGPRSTLIFLAAVVVVVTLIGQGLTLAPLVRVLGLAERDQQQRAEASARAKVTAAGLARLDELAKAGTVDDDTANLYRQLFELRLDRVRVALGDASADDVPDIGGPRHELVRAQRDKLAQLYRDGEISDDIRRSISRSLDLLEPRPFR